MKNADVILDGSSINSVEDFHNLLSDSLDFGPFYGGNLDALWDRLSTDVERPVRIVWLNSSLSKKSLGEYFDKVIQIFEETKQQDIRFGWIDQFDYILK